MQSKKVRDIDLSRLYILHIQGWELSHTGAGEDRTFRLTHTDGQHSGDHLLVRDAIADVVRIDPSILSRQRRRDAINRRLD